MYFNVMCELNTLVAIISINLTHVRFIEKYKIFYWIVLLFLKGSTS